LKAGIINVRDSVNSETAAAIAISYRQKQNEVNGNNFETMANWGQIYKDS